MAGMKKLALESLREFEAVSGMGVRAVVGDKSKCQNKLYSEFPFSILPTKTAIGNADGTYVFLK
jgi:hypothetical protein